MGDCSRAVVDEIMGADVAGYASDGDVTEASVLKGFGIRAGVGKRRTAFSTFRSFVNISCATNSSLPSILDNTAA